MITKVKRLNDDAFLPGYGYPGDAGMDLAVVGSFVLNPGESRDLPTGIAVELPPGYWARITGRSSTLRKRGLFVNEGVIDEGYRGELLVYVTNRQSTPVVINHGDRLAQLILHPVHQAPPEWADELSPSARGANGFGSTGFTGQTARAVQAAVAFHESVMDIDQLQQDGAQDTAQIAERFRDLGRSSMLSGPIYLGGAVDVGSRAETHEWRHADGWRGLKTYCPIHECADLTDPEEIIRRNMRALDMAADAVFLLDAFSIGTPIEAWHRIMHRARGAVLVWTGDRSVFIDALAKQPDVMMVTTVGRAMDAVRERAWIRAKVQPPTVGSSANT